MHWGFPCSRSITGDSYRLQETYVFSQSAQTAEEPQTEDDESGETHQDGRVKKHIQDVTDVFILLHQDPDPQQRHTQPHKLKQPRLLIY